MGGQELLDVRTADVLSLLDLDHTENLEEETLLSDQRAENTVATHVNRPEASTVAGGHVLVERLDRVCTTELPELLVHVVRAGARVVAEPDTEVLNLQRFLFVDLKSRRINDVG